MRCPTCNGDSVVPILYGNQGGEAYDIADRGLVELGGCIAFDNNPMWFCKSCNREFPLEDQTVSSHLNCVENVCMSGTVSETVAT